MGSLALFGGTGWDNFTVLLYLFISCAAAILSFASTRSDDSRSATVYFALAAALLIVFKALCVSGVDVRLGGGYYLNFMSAENLSSFRDNTIELGFIVLTILVRNLTDHYEIYLFVVAAVSILPVMCVAWKMRNRINLSFAVLGYSLAFLVTGMSATRQFMAVGVCLLAIYLYITKRKLAGGFVFLLAVSFHTSSLCCLLLLMFALMRKIRWLQVLAAVLVVVLCANAYLFADLLFTGRYSIYSLSGSGGFGAAVYLKYVPLLLFLVVVQSRVQKKHVGDERNNEAFDLCWTVLLFAVTIALIGYVIPIFGRAESFSLPLVIVVAYLIKQCEDEEYCRISSKVLVFGYFFFRFLLYMNDAYMSEGLMPYVTWLM